MRKHWGWFLLLVPLLIMGIANLVAWPHLGDRVPIHWNLHGEVDDWGRRGSVWILPILYFWVAGFLQLITLRLPGSSEPSHHITVNWLATGMAILFLCLYVHMLATALKPSEKVPVPLLNWGLAAFTIFLGLGLKSCKRNALIGIRTKWTMDSDEIWDKTHRLASTLFITAGIGMTLFASFFNLLLSVGVIVAICLVATFYSYQLHKGSKVS